MKTEEVKGWGLRVGGIRPYLAHNIFTSNKYEVERQCTANYHRPMKCVLVPLREWKSLKKKARSNAGVQARVCQSLGTTVGGKDGE